MNNEIRNKIILFAENSQNIRKGFKWDNALTKRLAAMLYTQKNKSVDNIAIRRCYELIKRNTGIFSMFRGNMVLCIATLLSLSDNPEYIFDNTLKVYDMLKDEGFYASDYLVVAAYQIAANSELKDYQRIVKRTREFYDDMKAHHWFYTGQDDYIFAAMLGLSDLDVAIESNRIERLYDDLKSGFTNKNSVQSLAHILVLANESDKIVYRIFELRDKAKSQRIRLDKIYTLLSLGVLALLPVDIETITNDLIEARDFFRTQKGFGAFSITMQELLLYASAIIASEYANGINDEILAAALSTNITNIMIAQQTAVIVTITASSTAAASS